MSTVKKSVSPLPFIEKGRTDFLLGIVCFALAVVKIMKKVGDCVVFQRILIPLYAAYGKAVCSVVIFNAALTDEKGTINNANISIYVAKWLFPETGGTEGDGGLRTGGVQQARDGGV